MAEQKSSTFEALSNKPKNDSKNRGVSRRKWSPCQARLRMRTKIEGDKVKLHQSLGSLSISDHDSDNRSSSLSSHSSRKSSLSTRSTNWWDNSEVSFSSDEEEEEKDDDDEEDDYLKRALNSMDKSEPIVSVPVRRGKRGDHSKMASSSSSSSPAASSSKEKKEKKEKKKKKKKESKSRSNSFDTTSAGDSKSKKKKKKKDKKEKDNEKHNYSARASANQRRTLIKDMLQEDIPVEIQHKLCKITDPSLPLKKKVEMEVELMTEGTPEEKEIYCLFKNKFDRQSFMEWKTEDDHDKWNTIENNALTEAEKEAAFNEALEKKRKKERKAAKKKKEEEERVKEDLRLHTAKTLANTMEGLRNAALKAVTVDVERNIREKKEEEEAVQRKIEKMRKKQGGDLVDAELVLKEALIVQQDPKKMRKKKEKKKKERRSMSAPRTQYY